MKRVIIGAIAVLLLGSSATAQRKSVSLEREWTYTPGWETSLDAPGTAVGLPHTWNTDALGAIPNYYRGLGGYFRAVEIPESWRGKRVFLRFGGANATCDLHVNGRHIGQHAGGYTAFAWEITRALNFGGRNSLIVRVNNAPDLNRPPLVGDFNVYGGLYRDVELIVTPESHIALDDYGSCGVYVTPTRVSAERADVNALAAVRGTGGEMVETTFIVRDAEGNRIDSLARRVKLDPQGRSEVAVSFSIDAPHLWGPGNPYLYSVETRVKGTSGGYDNVRQDFGLRWFEVDDQNRFLLNGQPLQIRGVCRIEDWDGIGNALRRQNHRRDVELIREMGANAVRCAYFPNDPYFLDLCDRAGILVWSDIPLIGAGPYRDKGFNDSQAFRANIRQQLLETIHQQYNHPSVVWFGLYDRLNQRGDDPLSLIRELKSVVDEEAGGRLSVAASNQNDELNYVPNLIGIYAFVGWQSGQPESFEEWTSDLFRNYPSLRSGLSGYGAGGSIYQWTDSLSRPEADGAWHPEQWQTRFHESYWSVIAKARPGYWGTFVWTMFDYGAAHRTDGARPGVADFGLITFDRRVCKDAFYFYKANWNKTDPFVRIVDSRYEERSSTHQTLRVFSNQSDVELFVNGRSLGLRSNDGLGRFVWKNATLHPGENTVEAIDPMTGQRDRTVITIRERLSLPAPSLPSGSSGSGTGNRTKARLQPLYRQ